MKRQQNRLDKFKHLAGKYNGWWIYQFAVGDEYARANICKKNRRRSKNVVSR
jgi:hypothetical protein